MQLTAYQAIYANGSTASNLPPGIQFTVHNAPAPGPGGEASPRLPSHCHTEGLVLRQRQSEFSRLPCTWIRASLREVHALDSGAQKSTN